LRKDLLFTAFELILGSYITNRAVNPFGIVIATNSSTILLASS